jgi:glycine dehydrogenase subunit 1
MFKYLPHTEQDIQHMLQVIGVQDINDLFLEIPASLKGFDLDVPRSHSELEIHRRFDALAAKNKPLIPFVGAGAYDHYTPSVIRHLIERQEFLTSYTPYQPEISQGTLQYIFEFQSIVCELTGMDVSNASMYDGATATAEAMFMACAARKKEKILIASTVNPNVIDVVKTYAKFKGIEVELVAEDHGIVDASDFAAKVSADVAGIIVQHPNKYGILEPLDHYRDALDEVKGLFILNSDLASLSLLRTPAEFGVDIAVGEAQSLGVPLQFGGPYIGYMATTTKLMRKMPGRICGMTEDKDGKRAFVLTLQAREQHIRREKANSNICSNQSLLALLVTVYTAVMGKQGVVEAQQQSHDNTHYLASKLVETGAFDWAFDHPFFKDVALRSNLDKDTIQQTATAAGFAGPLALENWDKSLEGQYLFSATEKRTKAEIDRFVDALGAI